MNKRPLSIIIVGCGFIACGILGIAYHAAEFNPKAPFEADLVLGLLVRLLAILGGIFLLRGANWAR